jgi:hypothetical protein
MPMLASDVVVAFGCMSKRFFLPKCRISALHAGGAPTKRTGFFSAKPK